MRLKIEITGIVQGVGFRPYIYRLARETGLSGYILNNTSGVLIEVEGEKQKLDEFLIRIDAEKPSVSKIYSLRHSFLRDKGFHDFEIRTSRKSGEKRALILPDISVCDECLEDIYSPEDRRFMYPFTNCTNCGPRFTIIQSIPYDRDNTTMKSFTMCAECEKEFHSPRDRRFHAQPDACPVCGPSVRLYDGKGNVICEKAEAVKKAVHSLKGRKIVAVKGIGGYHLMCDATSQETVDALRKKKNREEKPIAVMFPDMEMIKSEAHISPLEERAIRSRERPIVIVRKKHSTVLADSVSPDNRTVGVFLPYSPLHHIILTTLKKPVIATSANLTDEPIVKDEWDAFTRLADIADYTLTHDRDIARRCDDSVIRVAAERQIPVRRSRGFVPLPVPVPFKITKPVIALGPYMNNTIAVGIDDRVFLSQHVGDLDNTLATECYEETIHDLLRLFGVNPEIVVSDLHPGYYSTQFGEKNFRDRLVKVQHHFAHILSCMAENDVPEDSEVIGFSFDGTGYGMDKTIWGGEVLIASYKGFKRVFHLRPYRLPGGDKAVEEPFRTAFSLLYETFNEDASDLDLLPMTRKEKLFFMNMINKKINSPVTSSMGRLFDGIASIINLRHKVSFHAQAAIALEQISLDSDKKDTYPFTTENGIIDYRPIIRKIVDDIRSDTSKEKIAGKFHNTIAEIIVQVSESLRAESGITNVALSGGVFQNVVLLEQTFHRLKEREFTPIIHQTVPPNDGGISLGQIAFSQFL
jgi:hydrogenase maturation protein HypF